MKIWYWWLFSTYQVDGAVRGFFFRFFFSFTNIPWKNGGKWIAEMRHYGPVDAVRGVIVRLIRQMSIAETWNHAERFKDADLNIRLRQST